MITIDSTCEFWFSDKPMKLAKKSNKNDFFSGFLFVYAKCKKIIYNNIPFCIEIQFARF